MSSLAVCLSLVCLALGSRAQGTSERGLPHESPCPAVYSYGWGPAGGWHGVITILPPARFSEVQLVLRMTVPYYRPEAGVGRVEVKGGTPEIQAISRRAYRGERHKIQFMIIFPPFDDVPRVKEIFFNGRSFCAANQVYQDTRSTIELKYTLRSGLNIPLANGNEFSVVSAEPSRPDLVTVAILQPMDEARPPVSSPPSPSRPMSPAGPRPPCKCNKTQDFDDEHGVPMPHRPENHVFHAFRPPSPGVRGGQYEQDDGIGGSGNNGGNNYATPPPTSANRPQPGNGNNFVPPSSGFANRPSPGDGNNFVPPFSGSANRPPPGNGNNFVPPSSGSANRPPPGNGNNFVPPSSGSANRPSPGNDNSFAPPPSGFANRPPPGNDNNFAPPFSGFANRPPPTGGNNFALPSSGSANRPPPGNGNNFAPPSSGFANRPPPTNGNNFALPSSGSANRPPPGNGNNFAPPPPGSANPPPGKGNKEVDDTIYFIMAESDEANSPRVVKLLEHLLVVSKKHYQVDLERLQIEKKRLSLEKYPHYTFVI